MKKPIKLPVFHCSNFDYFQQMQEVSVKVEREYHLVSCLFFDISVIEPGRGVITSGMQEKSYIYSGGHSFTCYLDPDEILELMDLAGW